MKNLFIIGLTLLMSMVSCSKEDSDADLLYGSWALESDSGFPGPKIEFNTKGDYCMVDYASVSFAGTTFCGFKITGEFNISDNQITFNTAVVERLEEGAVGSEFPFMDVSITGDSPIGSFYIGLNIASPHQVGYFSGVLEVRYTPVVWEIITLTDNTLEVKIGIHTFRFVRR